MWAWYPNMETVVDNFNEGNDEVQVCWTNAGAGGDAYDKFQTADLGRRGAPMSMMIGGRPHPAPSRCRTRSST